MLRYWKDGKEVLCKPLKQSGSVGQTIILDCAAIGDDLNPLKKYVQPHVFTIVEKLDSHYVVKDAKGRCVNISFATSNPNRDPDCDYIYDATEFLAWRWGYYVEHNGRSQNKIRLLEAHVALLKDILIKSGTRIVTAEEAKELGLK
jgi:hypothetical protein